jgi:hypothetical protein
MTELENLAISARRWRASPTHKNRVHLDRAIDAYNRALRLLEDENERRGLILLNAIRGVA